MGLSCGSAIARGRLGSTGTVGLTVLGIESSTFPPQVVLVTWEWTRLIVGVVARCVVVGPLRIVVLGPTIVGTVALRRALSIGIVVALGRVGTVVAGLTSGRSRRTTGSALLGRRRIVLWSRHCGLQELHVFAECDKSFGVDAASLFLEFQFPSIGTTVESDRNLLVVGKQIVAIGLRQSFGNVTNVLDAGEKLTNRHVLGFASSTDVVLK